MKGSKINPDLITQAAGCGDTIQFFYKVPEKHDNMLNDNAKTETYLESYLFLNNTTLYVMLDIQVFL